METDTQLFSLGSELSKLVSPVVNRNRSCLCTPGTGGYTFAPCYRTSRRTMKERQEYFRHDKVSSRSVQGVTRPCTGNDTMSPSCATCFIQEALVIIPFPHFLIPPRCLRSHLPSTSFWRWTSWSSSYWSKIDSVWPSVYAWWAENRHGHVRLL